MPSKKETKIDKYAREMFVRQEQYAQNVKKRYDKATDKLLDLARQVKDDVGDKAFHFSDNPRVREEATEIIRQLYTEVYHDIKEGIEAEWEYANLSCDGIVLAAFGKRCLEQDAFARFFHRNKEALDQFFKRKNGFGGLNLSQKVWQYTGDLRTELENAISVSLGEGVSAATMSRRVRQYLQYPDKLFRRVKGADGKLHLSKNAKAFHPGQGVYRSSYKNAMRLTRTETNAAYRLADQDRWQRMDFVVGMRVHKSNNHPTEDICDVLAGDYPKTFKFSAWHPQCRCYVTSILCTKEEMMQMQRDILAGKSTNGFRSVNEVRTVPKAFTDWVDANGDRIMRAKALPYFLKDNGKIVDGKWVYGENVRGTISTPPVIVSSLSFKKAQDYAYKFYSGKPPKAITSLTSAKEIEAALENEIKDTLKAVDKYAPIYAKRNINIDNLYKHVKIEKDIIARKKIIEDIQKECGIIAKNDLISWRAVDGLAYDGLKLNYIEGTGMTKTTKSGVVVTIPKKHYDLITFKGASGQTYQYPLGVSKSDIIVNAGELEKEFVKFPEWMKKNNKGFVIINEDSPFDVFYKAEYTGFTRGAMYSSDPISIHTPHNALDAIYNIRHEISHHIYNRHVKKSDWITSVDADHKYHGAKIYPTAYASQAPTEDFAESLRFVSMGGNYEAAMQSNFPNRYAFLKAVIARL